LLPRQRGWNFLEKLYDRFFKMMECVVETGCMPHIVAGMELCAAETRRLACCVCYTLLPMRSSCWRRGYAQTWVAEKLK